MTRVETFVDETGRRYDVDVPDGWVVEVKSTVEFWAHPEGNVEVGIAEAADLRRLALPKFQERMRDYVARWFK